MRWYFPAVDEAKLVDERGKVVAYVTRRANGDYGARLNDINLGAYIDMASAQTAIEKADANPNSLASRR